MNGHNHAGSSNAEAATCPYCEQPVRTRLVDDILTCGTGEGAVDLEVRLPVRRCDPCDFEFIDHEGERIRTEAIYRHHGLLTPWEIRAIRERRGMSRAAFAEITGLGKATIKRWETGATPQNRANDRYIRLLDNDACWSVLARLAAPEPDAAHGQLLAGPWRRLDRESAKELHHHKVAFSLHTVHAA